MLKPIGKIKGVYINTETNSLELDVPEMLRFCGWEETEENKDKIIRIAREAVAEIYPNAEVVEK